MSAAYNAFSSDTVNRLSADARSRQERSMLRQNAEKEQLIRFQPIANWGLTFINMMIAGWVCYTMTADAGIGSSWVVNGYSFSFIPNIIGGLSGVFLAYLATSTAATFGDIQGFSGKLVISMVLVMGLFVSIFTSGFGEMVVIETANSRAEQVEERGSSRADALQTWKDKVTAAETLYNAATAQLSKAEENHTDAIAAERDAIDAKNKWWTDVVREHGITSAVANRRAKPEHPQRVTHNETIAQASALKVEAEQFAAEKRAKAERLYTVLAQARRDLAAKTESYAMGLELPNKYYAAADAMAGNFGMTGREMLAIFAFLLAVFMSLCAPLMSYANTCAVKPALKAADKHRHKQEIRRRADETLARPRVDYSEPVEPVAHPAQAAQPEPSPQPRPVPVMQTTTPEVKYTPEEAEALMQRYGSKCEDAINDARIRDLPSASVNPLKNRYSVNEEGADAIRFALVREGLAQWDGNRCKLNN